MKPVYFLLLYFLFSSCQKETIDPALIQQSTISSLHTGRIYDITVQLPDDYSTSSESYSTMYVLDAEHDDYFVGIKCKEVSTEYKTQNVIVIGIRYHKSNDRAIDYTPTATGHGKGGSPSFLNFIKKELIPDIQAKYNVDTLRTSRTIIGHSFGGLLGAYAFTKHNEVFGNYLLLSPSLFYDKSIILKYEQEVRESIKSKPQLVFIGLGSSEGGLIPANELFHERLNSFYPHTSSTFKLVSGRGHMSSKNINIENAIKFYFKNR
ncbi:alpha/beta hydrolase-fold protein [soil metagenome]